MSDWAQNLDTYNDGEGEERCPDCGSYDCACDTEEDWARYREEEGLNDL